MLDKVNGNLNGSWDQRLEPTDRIRFDQVEKNEVEGKNVTGEKSKKTLGIEECETCKNRTYQDDSDDPSVSFQAPTQMDPSQAAIRVMSHEGEHYANEKADAEKKGKEVVLNQIEIFTDVCPECGKTYVSGGLTTTMTRKKAEKADFLKQFYDQTVGKYRPERVDTTA